MKRFTLLFFFLAVWFLTACETDSCGCIVMDLGVEVAIEDGAGNDLLNPSTEGYFEKQDIDLYYDINGKLMTHASMNKGAQLDNPEGFSIVSDGTRYVLGITTNPTPGNKVATIIRIKEQSDIMLVTKVNGANGKRVEKIWYNDQLVWPVSGNDTFRRVTITLN